MGPQFHETIRGRTFYESTMPTIARELKRVADALEKQNELKEKELGLKDVADLAKEFVSEEGKDGNSDKGQ